MANQQTSCTYDGDTFVGTFAESGRGSDAAITVEHHGLRRTAQLGGISAGQAAQRLLTELVRERLSDEALPAA